MTPELRETLGKAAHHGMSDFFRQRGLLTVGAMLLPDDFLWDRLDGDTKELYRCEAEEVVSVYLASQQEQHS